MKKIFLISFFLSFYVFPINAINAHEEDPLNDCMDLLETDGRYKILDIANSCKGARIGTVKCMKRLISNGLYPIDAARACTNKNKS